MKDQAEVLRKMVSIGSTNKKNRAPRMIAVTSGKGGVGKTNVAVNLSLSLSQLGFKVALFDVDLGLANVDILLGISPKFTLTHVLRGDKSINDIVVDGPFGLKVVPGGSGVYDLANLNGWKLGEFVRSVDHLDGRFDFMFLDTGGGIHRNVLSFVLAVDEVIVVTTPEPTAITDAYGMIKVIKQRNPKASIQLVVNSAKNPTDAEMVWNRLNAVLKQFLNTETKYAGYVLYDPNVSRAVSEQQPFVIAYPHTSASRSIERIAHTLSGQSYAPLEGGIKGFFGKVYNLLQRS